MRRFILRAGVVVALLVLAASADANPRGTIARDPQAVRGIEPAAHRADSAPSWMTDTLLGAFYRPAGASPPAHAPAATRDAEREQSSRPHQNPAFPAAFVFQSHSALFLALNTNAARHGVAAS